MKTFACVMAIALVCWAGAVRADFVTGNLVTNGSFDTNLSGWNPSSLAAWDNESPVPGNALLYNGSSIDQRNTTHAFATGETYTVSFLASTLGGGGAATQYLWVRLFDMDRVATVVKDLIVTAEQLNQHGDGIVGFEPYSFTYSVPAERVGHSWDVEFDGVQLNAWIGVDNISVTASVIPEPTALALLVTGVIGLLAYAWKKRR